MRSVCTPGPTQPLLHQIVLYHPSPDTLVTRSAWAVTRLGWPTASGVRNSGAHAVATAFNRLQVICRPYLLQSEPLDGPRVGPNPVSD